MALSSDPPIWRSRELFNRCRLEMPTLRQPHLSFDRDVWPLDRDDVERIRLSAPPRRCARTGRHDQRRVAGHTVALRVVTYVSNMKMPGEQHINSARGKCRDCET